MDKNCCDNGGMMIPTRHNNHPAARPHHHHRYPNGNCPDYEQPVYHHCGIDHQTLSPYPYNWCNKSIPTVFSQALSYEEQVLCLADAFRKLCCKLKLNVPYLIDLQYQNTTNTVRIFGSLMLDYEKVSLDKEFVLDGMADGTYYVNIINDPEAHCDPCVGERFVYLSNKYMPDNHTTLYIITLQGNEVKSVVFNDLYTHMHNIDPNAHAELIAEIYEDMQAIQDDLASFKAEVNERFTGIDGEIDDINDKIDGLNGDITAQINAINTRMDNQFSIYDTHFANVDSQIVGLEQDLSQLRTEFNTLSNKVDGYQIQINNTNTRIDELTTSVNTRFGSMQTSIQAVSNAVATEASQRQQSDANIIADYTSKVNALRDYTDTNIDALTTLVNNNIQNYDALSQRVDNVAIQLTSEISTRSAKDIELQDKINTETTTRIAQDSILQDHINDEASVRANGDNNLQIQIDNINLDATRIDAELTDLNQDLDNERLERINSDQALNGVITSVSDGLQNITNELHTYEGINDARVSALTATVDDILPITGDKIVDGTITNVDIANNTINGSQKLADVSVTTSKIADNNVTTAKIADNAITSTKIADGAIATNDIADGAITSAKIADGTIASADLANNCVTATKLSDNSISAQRLMPDSVTTNKILDANVTTPKIADFNVTTSKLADGSVTSAKIADGTIVAADIANGTITGAKLAAGTVPVSVTSPAKATMNLDLIGRPLNSTTQFMKYTDYSFAGGIQFVDGVVFRCTKACRLLVSVCTFGNSDGSTIEDWAITLFTSFRYGSIIHSTTFPNAPTISGSFIIDVSANQDLKFEFTGVLKNNLSTLANVIISELP